MCLALWKQFFKNLIRIILAMENWTVHSFFTEKKIMNKFAIVGWKKFRLIILIAGCLHFIILTKIFEASVCFRCFIISLFKLTSNKGTYYYTGPCPCVEKFHPTYLQICMLHLGLKMRSHHMFSEKLKFYLRIDVNLP